MSIVTYTKAKIDALLGAKADLASLATVARTGAYADLTGKPALATVATTGAYSSLAGVPRDATLPTGALAQNVSRSNFMQVQTLVSGRVLMSTGSQAIIRAGTTVSSITLVAASTAGASMTHQWFCITDLTGSVLAVTVDDLANAWAANAPKTLALTSPWTPSVDSQVYVGACVVGTTPPTVLGVSTAGSGNGVAALAPSMGGQAAAGLTTPPALGFNALAGLTSGNVAYWYVS